MLGNSYDTSVPAIRGEAGFSLRDIIFILFRRRWIILAIALPIILIGGFGLTRQTGTYTANARVVVELIKVDLPQWNTQGRNVDYDRELSTLVNIGMSLPVVDIASSALVDSIPLMMSLAPKLIGLDEKGMLTEFLQGGLNVSVVGESAILDFSFTSLHPRVSLMASGAVRDAFVEFQVHGRKNVKAVEYYEEQITSVRAEIDSLLTLRANVMKESGYTNLSDEFRYEIGRIANLESKLNEATVSRRILEVQYEALVGYLDRDPRNFPMGPNENSSTTLVVWRNLITQYEDELGTILVNYTEQSDAAQRQNELIKNALVSLGREQRNYVNSFLIPLLSAREKEAVLAKQIANIKAGSDKGPEIYQRVSLLDAEIESLRGLFEDLQTKRGEVRLTQLADERVSPIVVLTHPELSTIISGGKTVIYFVVIVLFALALGVVMAFIFENLDHRIYGPKDIEDNLKLPVFASVSKVE